MQLSLLSILPDFWSLINEFGSAASISAIFWLLEVGVFLFFIVRLQQGRNESLKSIAYLKDILKGAARDSLLSERRNLKEKAAKHPVCRTIWCDFDETLVASPNSEQLYNTFSAEHFFNTHSLASKITESRLLAAVPGFLTAIGVVGTFLGLQLGLGALNLNTGDTEQLKSAISALISSASIAFMTSVWGVALSLLFNAREKFVEGKVRREIALLQQRIDELFPQLIAEQTLLDIRNDGSQSKETLMGLAEQIGDRMQIAVQDLATTVATGMETSLERIMSPAIEKMVEASNDFANKQANSSEDALKGLLGEFMEGMGQAGMQQQSIMQQASQDMNRSMEEWGTGMSQFLSQLNLTVSRFEDMSQQQNDTLKEQLEKTVSSQQNNAEFVTGQMKSMASTLMSDVKEHQQQIAEAEQGRLDNLSKQLNESAQQQAEQLTQISTSSFAAAEEFQGTMRTSMETLISEYENRQKSVAAGDVQRQEKLMAELSGFVETQKKQLNSTLIKATSVNDEFSQTLQKRMEALSEIDKERDQRTRVQIEEMQTNAATLVDDMKQAMDGHLQSVQVVLQQANTLNAGIERNQHGLNSAAESIVSASQAMDSASVNLHKGHQEVARATESISGTLTLTTSAVAKTSQQNAEVAEGLQKTLDGLDGLQTSLEYISEDLRLGAQNADNASRELSSNHARYRQEMQDAIGQLHEQLGILLNSYAKQVQDQTSHRMEEWNRHTQDYVNGMSGVVNVMQELVDDMDRRVA